MDVEVPDKPIRSVKDFLVHLVTIVAGVLIALSFEGAREWLHNRSLVREAKENLVREISENKKEIDRGAKRIAEERADLQKALAWATELLTTKQSSIKGITIGTVLPGLTTSSWQTAERTGALGHMKYGEVQAFAKIYGLQQVYTNNRLQKLDRIAAALGVFSNKVGAEKAQPEDLQNMRAQLLLLLGNLWAEENLLRDLSRVYERGLQLYGGQ
jgi:hypothetical protein